MKYLIIVIITFLSTGLLAQDKNQKEQRLESQKVAFITSNLDLSPTEAQQFWPLYNEYRKTLRSIRTQLNDKYDEGRKTLSEEEAESYLSSYLDKEEKELNLKKEFIKDLKSIIPSSKTVIFLSIERKFKDQILKSIKNKMKRRYRRGE